MVTLSGFSGVKSRYARGLEKDLKEGRVDWDIGGWLVEVNRRRCLATTSSCSGRVIVLYSNDMMDKAGSRLLWSWHDPRECRLSICGVSPIGPYKWWASLQPPIIHFLAQDLDTAEYIVKCGSIAGFSKLGYKYHRSGFIHVEVGGGDKLHVILPADCNILLELCMLLEVYKDRLKKFMECVLNVPC